MDTTADLSDDTTEEYNAATYKYQEVFEAAERNDLDAVKMYIENGGVHPSAITRDWNTKRWKENLVHIAARNNYLNMLIYLVERDPSVLKEKEGVKSMWNDLSILDEAVEKGALDVVKYLVENHNANICAETSILGSGYLTPIHRAINAGHLNVTRYFIEERNVDVNRPCKTDGGSFFPLTPLLFQAIRFKKRDIIRYLIEERKADLTIIDRYNENILFTAVRDANFGLHFLKNVLDEKKAKIDVNWQNNHGETLLWTAVSYAYLNPSLNLNDTVRYLVEEKRADVNILDSENKQSSLHLAASRSDAYGFIVQYLIDHGANVHQQDKSGNTPLHLAWSLSPCIQLIKNGADVNQRNHENQTALDIAISKEKPNYEVCKYLIEHGAHTGRQYDNGETLLHSAATRNQIPLLDYLTREKSFDVNAPRTSDHWTPLHCAAFWSHYESCEYLIKHGANPVAKGKGGKTPAQVAQKKRVIDFIQNATNTRARRSVRKYQLSAHLHNQPLYGDALPEITGDLSACVGDTPLFQFHDFLAFAPWLVWNLRALTVPWSHAEPEGTMSREENIRSRIDSVAEAIVDAISNFQEV